MCLFLLIRFIWRLWPHNFLFLGGVISFGLASGQIPLADSSITFQCIVDDPETTYRIWNGKVESALTTCVIPSKCLPEQGLGNRFLPSPNGITVEIQKLDRSRDETTWTCTDNYDNQEEFYLRVYSKFLYYIITKKKRYRKITQIYLYMYLPADRHWNTLCLSNYYLQ